MKQIGLAVLIASTLASGALADSDRSQVYLVEQKVSAPPIGYVQFCRRYQSECLTAAAASASPSPALTAGLWRQLNEVNDDVNVSVEPVTDADQYGLAEYWTYPGRKGDCEDYVLMKRKRLLEMGWSRDSLLITVVRDQDGGGHAVLVVATSAGDLVLDNQDPAIRTWNDTPYKYLKRQSRRNPALWVDLEDNRSLSTPSVTATTRSGVTRP